MTGHLAQVNGRWTLEYPLSFPDLEGGHLGFCGPTSTSIPRMAAWMLICSGHCVLEYVNCDTFMNLSKNNDSWCSLESESQVKSYAQLIQECHFLDYKHRKGHSRLICHDCNESSSDNISNKEQSSPISIRSSSSSGWFFFSKPGCEHLFHAVSCSCPPCTAQALFLLWTQRKANVSCT